MNNELMEIYVQSRGFSQEDGYCWLPEKPSILATSQVSDLIQSESPSLVLGRYSSKLLLLVTGLEASKRRDFRDRKIRNSVVWVSEDSEQEQRILRMIAVRALRDWDSLREDINVAVQFGSEQGFQVLFEEIKLLTMKGKDLPASGQLNNDEELNYKISKNLAERKQELANLLEQYSLPKREGSLLVVTEIKAEETLVKAQVWRGLSNLVNSDNWKVIGTQVTPNASKSSALSFGQVGEKSAKDKSLALVMFAAVVAGMMMLWGIVF
ncbi:MAG: hypothetical protein F6K36_22360 [Symploca sp. SIO3C6]|uniref:Uncharacterized protein n=1 Tax=Symploca sp. SIO1C4 TaxID=2607765 RepID=A0A6B3N6A4_9CYAN|nr:hypothetical protein [Symploca sp. SIO3C6]NER27093.1 hypothetical protein [Symploca sp. SIO1C4]NET04414.1 hypothetical protein [Symploca sp. SIO2B6]